MIPIPRVYQVSDTTFFIHRDSLSDEVFEWVDSLDPRDFFYESHICDFSPFESYTFYDLDDAVLFKLFWLGR